MLSVKEVVFVLTDLDISITSERSTDTSIDLSWTTTSQNCLTVLHLQKLSYVCSCWPSSQKHNGK